MEVGYPRNRLIMSQIRECRGDMVFCIMSYARNFEQQVEVGCHDLRRASLIGREPRHRVVPTRWADHTRRNRKTFRDNLADLVAPIALLQHVENEVKRGFGLIRYFTLPGRSCAPKGKRSLRVGVNWHFQSEEDIFGEGLEARQTAWH